MSRPTPWRKVLDTCHLIQQLAEDAGNTYLAAHREARAPARRNDSTRHSGISDPTGHTAAILADHLEHVAAKLKGVQRDLEQIVNRDLAEWGPDKPAPAPAKRCGQPDCARPHSSRGLCHTHYMQRWRTGDLPEAAGA